MFSKRGLIALSVILFLLAGALRFSRLGAWPFAGDETATFDETDSLFKKSTASPESQIDRLPRMVPLAHSVHQLGYVLFGRNEFGSRVMPALLGTLTVLVIFLALQRPMGRPTALATALLVAVWPEHLFQSQQNRFYMTTWFFSSLCLLAGSWALEKRSAFLVLLACLAAFAAVLCHTLQIVLLGGLFLGILTSALAEKRPMPWSLLATVALAGLGIVCFVFWYVVPLGRGWNTGEGWGYGTSRSLLGSLSQVGWPTVILAALGALTVVKERTAQGWYWLTAAATWFAAGFVLPPFVRYHPSYVFPMALGVFVLAGSAVGSIYECLQRRGQVIACAWMFAACALNLPGLVSHFRDGSRYDYRTAARYVAEHWRPGDRIAATSPGLLAYYAPVCDQAVGISSWDPLPGVRELSDAPGRLWIVLRVGRGGHPEPVRKWLRTHCRQELEVRKPRFDYYDYIVEVYLHSRAPEGAITKTTTVPGGRSGALASKE
jgi:hypothetical protein